MGQLSPRRGVYTGVFDPIHLGHLDIIQRASSIFDELIVGVGVNPEKTPFFSIDERVSLIKQVVTPYPNVMVRPFTDELAVRFVRNQKARIMVRGLRTLSDMEYEFTMSLMNLNLDPQIETVFLMAKEEFSHVSSSLLRQIAVLGGDLSKFLPPVVAAALVARAQELKKPGRPPEDPALRGSAS
jgi:pantetheine-phosphate adenylyltransferase